jgi:hypothetical protein
MKTFFIVLAFVILSAIIFSVSSHAMSVDFRSSAWAAADGHHSHGVTYGSLSVTATAYWGQHSANLGWWRHDGLGIYGGEPDEIDRREWLQVSFSRPVKINKVLFTDLFRRHPNGHNDGTPFCGEVAAIGFRGETYFYHGTDPGTGNGELWAGTDFQGITALNFWAPMGTDNEFSLGAIECSEVPIPGAIWLFGTGLMGLVAVRRKR